MTSKREIEEIETRIGELEEPLLGDENLSIEDFPQILMQNLREHYGYGSGDSDQ